MKIIPILTSTSVDGTVTVSIEQVGYTYQIDAGFIPEIQKLFRHRPWAGVNLLKRKTYHHTTTMLNKKEVKNYGPKTRRNYTH